MPVERHRLGGNQDNEMILALQAQLAAAQAEAAMLRGQVTDLTRMVAAERNPAVRQAIADAQAGPRHRRPPEARWLRAVPAVVVMAFRPARHKLLAGAVAASALVAVTAPGMNLAPWIAGTPPGQAHARGAPSPAARVLPAHVPPGKGKGGGGGVASPPRGKPSSPPGKPGPSPAATPTDAGTATGTATDTPSPDPAATATATPDTATPSPGPAATGTPGPDPAATATAAACPPPGKPKH